MRYYRFPENKITKLLFGLFLTVMLFLARDTLVTSSILGFTKAQMLMIVCICVAALVFLIYNRRHWKEILRDGRVGILAVVTVVILLPMIVKRDWQLMYFSVLICLYFAVFLTCFISSREVARYYVAIMTVLGVYSIIAMWILRPLLVDTGILAVPMFCNQMDIPFYNFGLSFVSEWYVKTRNFGIFREPGVYQYFIILALFLNNYVVEWKRERTWWVCNLALAATMLSTLATGGVAELALLALVVFIDRKLYKNKVVWVCILIFAVLLGALAYKIIADQGDLYWEIYSMVVGKFQPGEDSFAERMDAISADLNLFLTNPLLGEKLSTVLYAAENNTTSTLILCAGFGILGGALGVLAWFALIWDKKRKLWVRLLLIPILFLSFNTQNLIADVFFWLFPMMALTERIVPRLKKKE